MSSAFDRKEVADKAHSVAYIARALVCSIRGAEERNVDQDAESRRVDIASLGELAQVLSDKVEEIASDLHG